MKNINLISISGRIGSGKDTVASMIQFLTRSNNYKGSCDLKSEFEDWDRGLPIMSPWQIKKFAGKLKQIASILTGIPVEKFEDQEFKKSFLGEEWSSFSPDIYKNDILVHHGKEYKMTIREFLQKLGTDGLRDGLHENVWVNALFADWKGYTPKAHSGSFDQENCYSHAKCANCGKPYYGFKRQYACKECIDKISPIYPHWIITDTRFPNELQSVKDRGGFTVRLIRNSDVHSDHISETALDEAEFDYVIDNKNETLEETFCSVAEMIDRFKI